MSDPLHLTDQDRLDLTQSIRAQINLLTADELLLQKHTLPHAHVSSYIARLHDLLDRIDPTGPPHRLPAVFNPAAPST